MAGKMCWLSAGSLPWVVGQGAFVSLLLGLFMGLLGLPHSMVAGFQECSKRQEVEHTGLLRPGPENRHSVTSAIFYCPSSHRTHPSKNIKPHFLGMLKKLGLSLICDTLCSIELLLSSPCFHAFSRIRAVQKVSSHIL